MGLPIHEIASLAPSASVAIVAEGEGVPRFDGVNAALDDPDVDLRLFGKPRVTGKRRVAVVLARGAHVDAARERARRAAARLRVMLD